MVADPPSLILAMATNMTFLDFYWFQGRPGLGTLSILGVLVALSTLLYLHRNLNAPLQIQVDQYRVPKGSKILVVGSIFLGIACLVLKTWFSSLVLIGILGIFAALVFFLEPRLAKEDNTGEATGSANEKREILFLAPSAVFVLSVFALILAPTTPPSGFLGLVSRDIYCDRFSRPCGDPFRTGRYSFKNRSYESGPCIYPDNLAQRSSLCVY